MQGDWEIRLHGSAEAMLGTRVSGDSEAAGAASPAREYGPSQPVE